MKSTCFVITWTIIFVLFSLVNYQKVDELSHEYINKFKLIENEIKDENWKNANSLLKNTKVELKEEKRRWYKIINHSYFSEIFISMQILDEGIYLKDKMVTLEEISRVNIILQNVREDEYYNLNRIF